MAMEKKAIVVPWDFSKIADHAFTHAAKIAKMVDNPIVLLHIVGKGIKTAEYKKREDKLRHLCEEYSGKFEVRAGFALLPGTIFTAIAEYVNEHEASLVVMGTHGIKGMQKLTGSWALKVIIGSKVPFVVVQEPPKDMEKYHDIVLPVDFRTESRDKLKMAIFMGKYFDSKVHILKSVTTDKALKKKVNVNLSFAMKFLMQNNIEYKIHEVPKGNLAQKTIEFAQKINADAIMIVTTKNITMADFMLGAQEQYIIGNSSKIPVCVVNPKASFAKVAQFMYG